MSGERLIYMPLGGAGEIGMNAYVYGYGKPGQERLIVVDLGVTFGDMDGTPGIDLILPDVAWLAERRDRIEAIVITHAHEDHIGALAALTGPLVEVHISNIHRREAFRQHSYVSAVADGVIAGLGVEGYVLALQLMSLRGHR